MLFMISIDVYGQQLPVPPKPEVSSSDASLKKLQTDYDELAAEVKELREAEARKKEKSASTFTFKMGGQLVMDMLWFAQSAESRATVGDANDVFDFRRARLYATGELSDRWFYATGFDFAQGSGDNGRPVFLDNFIGVKDLDYIGTLRIGHFFEPFTLERSGSNRNTMFMERSLVDLFAPSRNIGIMAHKQSESKAFWHAIGTFRGTTDNFGDDAGDQSGQTVDTRFVWRPYYNSNDPSHYLHLGTAYSFRDAADGRLQYRSRPEVSGSEDPTNPATPFFVDTGNLAADYSQLWGGELLWTNGPLSIQSEVVASPVRLSTGEQVNFSGYYASAGYFLTGEYIPYNDEYAITDRVKPLRPVFERNSDGGQSVTGIGAWQIASRISHADLTDGSISGGRLTDATIGLNWFLTSYHRMKFNYVLANLNRHNLRSQTSIFGLRFDLDF